MTYGNEEEDERRTLHDLYGEPRPDPALKARIGARLAAERRRRRVRTRLTLATAGCAAVALAFAIPGIASRADRPQTGTGVLSGRSILLAAAATAASATTASGAYWHVEKLWRRPHLVGSGVQGYWVVESGVTELWVARDGGQVLIGARSLGARPRSAADEAAWRRAGSPDRWQIGGSALRAKPGAATLKVSGSAPFTMAGRPVTVAQIGGLPADEGALRKWVTANVRGTPRGADDGVLADAVSGLLWTKPSPSGVRAAAYRVLAGLPAVRYLGPATDERGRAGQAFGFAPSPGVERTLVIDPATSQVLSSTDTGTARTDPKTDPRTDPTTSTQPGPQTDPTTSPTTNPTTGPRVGREAGRGAVESYREVVIEVGWTDATPTLPRLP